MAIEITLAKVKRVFKDGARSSTSAKDFLGINGYDAEGNQVLTVRKG